MAIFFIYCVLLCIGCIQSGEVVPPRNPETELTKWKRAADVTINRFTQSIGYALVCAEMKRPRNMILFIGDGMSLSTITAARYLKAFQRKQMAGEVLLRWEDWPTVSLVRTFSLDRMVTDSGAAATAFLSGTKVLGLTIGLSNISKCCDCVPFGSDQTLRSTLIQAQAKGLSTGIVTTTRITDATPAAAYAHVFDRYQEHSEQKSNSSDGFVCPDIASQLISNGLDFNVVLGGGSRMFYQHIDPLTPQREGSRKDGKNLLAQWTVQQTRLRRKHKLIVNGTALTELNVSDVDYLLGLISHDHLDYEITRPRDQPTLEEMTKIAIKILSRNNKGFFLLVEGGRVDHGHHANKAKLALTETLAMESAVETAMRMVNPDDTLMVVTADHSHPYNVVGRAKRTTNVLDIETWKAEDKLPFLISAYINGPGALVNQSRSNPNQTDRFDNNFRQQALVPLVYSTHAAEDVPLYAIGPFNEMFQPTLDNTYIAHATMFALCLDSYENATHCSIHSASMTWGVNVNHIYLGLFFSQLFLHLHSC